MRPNLPIVLTWLRIVAIPLLIALYYFPAGADLAASRDFLACILFCAAALTDGLDGYLARRLNQTSAFGAFLDPVADKLMVAAALILLVQLKRVDVIVAVIIIGREITISALREWMAQIGAHQSVAVSMLGKIKTTAQMLSIPLLFYAAPLWGIPIEQLGQILSYVAAVLTLWSMAYYIRVAWPELVKRQPPV